VTKTNLLWLSLSCIGGMLSALLFLKVLPFFVPSPATPVLHLLGENKPVVIGFIPYWLIGKVEPNSLSDITTATYFGLALNSDGTIMKQTNPDETEPGWLSLDKEKFTELLKDKPPAQLQRSLLVHLADEEKISDLLLDPTNHAQNVVNEVEPLMKQYQFTDLNLDIESFKTASPSARENMSIFLREIKKEVTQRQLGSLTIELAPGALIREYVLEPEVVGEVADYVVLMAYDFYYSGSPITGPVAPLTAARGKSSPRLPGPGPGSCIRLA
jgi:hypothetical protein